MKRITTKYNLLALTISAILSANAVAAEQSTEQDATLEVIEVTARKMVENLQLVPVSVTSISDTDIEKAGIETVVELQKLSPNTTLQVSRGTNTTLTAYIRGVGQQDPLWGYEPGVGIYVDDVYMARPQGAVLDVFDISRIEILRGPQGTLYGKNTIGGALKYVTKEMSGDSEFKISGGSGSYNKRDIKLAGQFAAIEDKLYFGAAIAKFSRDGFGNFTTTSNENYNKDVLAWRITGEYHATDDVMIRLVVDQTVDDSNAKGGHRLTVDPITSAPVLDNVYDSAAGMPSDNKVESQGIALTVAWDVNDSWGFKSITASRDSDTRSNIDFDNLPGQWMDVFATYDDEQFSQEFQVSYTDDKLSGVMGLYYFDGQACGRYDLLLAALSVSTSTSGCVDTTSSAIYGQASYQLADLWSLTLGGRYTSDKKSALVQGYSYAGLDTSVAPLATVSDFTNKETFSHFSPRIGVEYQAQDDLMYYASYSQGFKSGGFNMRAKQSVDPKGAHLPFDQEIVNSYEVGFKSQLLDDSLRLNMSAFFSDYQDMQVTTSSLRDTDDDGILDTPVQVVLNAGQATIKGIELEAVAVVSSALTFNFNIGYIDAKFDQFINIDPQTNQPVNYANLKKISNTPDISASLNANYEISLGDAGDLIIYGGISHRGESFIFEEQSILDEDSYTLLDAGLMFYSASGEWTVGLHGKNLGDKQVRIAGYNFAAPYFADSIIGYYNDPRIINLSFSYQF